MSKKTTPTPTPQAAAPKTKKAPAAATRPKAVIALIDRAAAEQKAIDAARTVIDKGIGRRDVLILKLVAKGLTAAEINAVTNIRAQTVRDVIRLEKASAAALRDLFDN